MTYFDSPENREVFFEEALCDECKTAEGIHATLYTTIIGPIRRGHRQERKQPPYGDQL